MGWEVGEERKCEAGRWRRDDWTGRLSRAKPHAVPRMTGCTDEQTPCYLSRDARYVSAAETFPPAAQLQPVLLSWWSGTVGRILRKGW